MISRITSRRCIRLAGIVLAVVGFARFAHATASPFVIGTNDFLLDGKPFQIRCGEMHFARIPREYWASRLRMAHAMGLNTVCAYLFWNLHEPAPGKFNFSGNADVAEFCRLAQKEGLKVILRPGPYACAEWDFGGFPSWLLKIPDIKLRTRDPRYLDACKRYLAAAGEKLARLQITHGGPIIMVQVENEYGSYGNDKEYIRILRDDLKQAGFDVPLFTCDGPPMLKNDTLEDLFCAANFDGNPEGNFAQLRRVRPAGPLMCGEYYPGWFDSWGLNHHYGDTAKIVRDLGWMLNHDGSFSIYVVHGGTSFGFDSGANSSLANGKPFSPQVTSYDYDAPISEAGWITQKYQALRELFINHLSPGESVPVVPVRNPVIKIEPMELTEVAPLFSNLPKPKKDERPESMEMYDQAHGCILYRTRLGKSGDGERLVIRDIHDYGFVMLDGKKLTPEGSERAVIDRRLAPLPRERRRNQNPGAAASGEFAITAPTIVALPAQGDGAVLDILVDTFGHINYGPDIRDPKGIAQKVELIATNATNELTGWEVFNFPLDAPELKALKFKPGASDMPAFYRATFRLAQTGDTFIDMSAWGRGVVWVNGHNLGRFWNIGPQQTLYCPGPWLKTGRNVVIVFEFHGTRTHRLAGLEAPILNEVHNAN